MKADMETGGCVLRKRKFTSRGGFRGELLNLCLKIKEIL